MHMIHKYLAAAKNDG